MKNLFLLTIILSISTSIRAQNVGDSITLKLNKISINSNLVGFAVAIVNKDSIVYAKGFGYANLEAKTPYTINTIQPIASISKTLLGVALMKAQEMGKLNLNDNINDYLPFKIYNPNFKSNDALKEAMGYILGMGFAFKAKPEAFASSSCANKVVN